MLVNLENWNFSFYKQEQYKAFISFCAQPIENTSEVEVQYAVTVTDGDDNELFQQNHSQLEQAINQLNERYQKWEFFNLSERSDKGGCGTCSAH